MLYLAGLPLGQAKSSLGKEGDQNKPDIVSVPWGWRLIAQTKATSLPLLVIDAKQGIIVESAPWRLHEIE